MLLSFVWMMSCNPAQLIRAPKIKPMPKVDTSAQEARQHLYTASYFHVKQDQANMELHLQQAWLRTEDPGICIFWGDLLLEMQLKDEAKQRWEDCLSATMPSNTNHRQQIWRRLNALNLLDSN